jgi:hypothetical protein
MGWFRGQKRLGAWLALVALALQLGLSFGHVHHQAVGHAAETAAGEPGGGEPEHGDNDYCPVFAILSLLAGAQTGSDPVIPAPALFATKAIFAGTEADRAATQQTAFRSRAPPPS